MESLSCENKLKQHVALVRILIYSGNTGGSKNRGKKKRQIRAFDRELSSVLI